MFLFIFLSHRRAAQGEEASLFIGVAADTAPYRNHETGREPLEIIESNLPAKAGSLQKIIQVDSEYLRRRLHHLSGQPVPMLCHSHCEKAFPHISVPVCAVCSLPSCCTPLKRACSPHSFDRGLPSFTGMELISCIVFAMLLFWIVF